MLFLSFRRTTQSIPKVYKMELKRNQITKSLSCRYISTIILSKGCGVFGALGHSNDLYDLDCFKLVEYFIRENEDIKQISAGWGHSAVVTKTGKLYIFGRPYDFSSLMKIEQMYKISKFIARYVSSSSNSFVFGTTGISNIGFYPIPTSVDIDNQLVKYVSCSAGLTVYLTETGDVYCFGLNRWNQCGLEVIQDIHVFQPYKIPNLPPCQSIDTGLQHCIALTHDGTVFVWGKASKGQLGIFANKDDLPQSSLPSKVAFPLTVLKVSAGFAHSAAILADGSVYVWGRAMSESGKNKNFLSGSIHTCEDQLIPRKLTIPNNRIAVDICSSNFNLIIICSDGSLWAIGMGEHDRNANPNPLQVQEEEQQQQRQEEEEEIVPDTGTVDINKIYVHVPQHSLIRKGQLRVSIFIPKPNKNTSNINYNSYEVVVHKGEAYLINLHITCATDNYLQENRKVIDFSSGWRHSLVLFEKNTL